MLPSPGLLPPSGRAKLFQIIWRGRAAHGKRPKTGAVRKPGGKFITEGEEHADEFLLRIEDGQLAEVVEHGGHPGIGCTKCKPLWNVLQGSGNVRESCHPALA